MEKKDKEILKEELIESSKSLIFGGLAILIVAFVGNWIEKTYILPSWLSIFVVYIAPWIIALVQISLMIRIIKIKRAMKN
ncbi:hypothetical protein COO16_04110 [Bacillus pseudomycoides]|uniref:hypothetical protein n=1 Tax=Bacillus pseudomycoides TaxID=64104 RepID=UPI000BEB67C6|nr:hypothetical protein [Bacillus pseudomycoides]PDY14153.1 hypothetical protein COO16_04110 [Bacillus pseudomycoides]